MKTKYLAPIIFFTALLSIISTQSHAAPVIYDESIDGDITTLTFMNFNLGAGTNIISGSMYSSSVSIEGDNDSFNFTLGDNMELISVEYYFSNIVAENVNNYVDSRFLNFDLSDLSDFDKETITLFNIVGGVDTSPVMLFTSSLPLIGPGTYGLHESGGVNPSASDWSVSWDYELRLTVTAVPVPPALWLFLSGLISIFPLIKASKG